MTKNRETMKKETMSDAVVRAIGPDAAKEFAKFVEVADSLPGLPAVQPQPMETGKDFDMFGYDLLAQVQHVTDDCVRLFVLHNNSSHVLVAEAHAMSEPSDTVQEPAKLVAAYPYIGEHDWRVAYKLALAEAVRLAHKRDDSCPGCGCLPGDGTTAGCTHPQGCGYFADCANDNAPAAPRTERERLSAIANHVEPRD